MEVEKIKEEIKKIHRETRFDNLFKASLFRGNETPEEFDKILDKCQCLQYRILKQ